MPEIQIYLILSYLMQPIQGMFRAKPVLAFVKEVVRIAE